MSERTNDRGKLKEGTRMEQHNGEKVKRERPRRRMLKLSHVRLAEREESEDVRVYSVFTVASRCFQHANALSSRLDIHVL